jgi:hypothetical protein
MSISYGISGTCIDINQIVSADSIYTIIQRLK